MTHISNMLPSEFRGDGLALLNVQKSYGGVSVLHDLSLEVGKGQLLSLLGPSGCGKTTTLNMIAGFANLNSGHIFLGGKDITQDPPNRRDMTIVFQNYALFPHMTVMDNVGYGLKARRMPAKDIAQRVNRMLDLLDIGALSKRYPGELSGGQQQRVSLARAIAVHPSLLLLDEPLSNLDTKLRQEIRLEIRNLQQELQQTAVFVTHDQEEALVISDRIAVLNKGWLEQLGTPQDLWEHPKTAYVADFMGVENILNVTLDGRLLRISAAGPNAGVVVPLPPAELSHVGFRPANARLAESGYTPSDPALVLDAVITGKAYKGTSYRYTCSVHDEGARPVQVEQPIRDFQAEQGQPVKIVVHPSGLLPLASSEAAMQALRVNREAA